MKFRRGQALLVVLLMVGVALTVGISIASRSTTEVSISTTHQEAARALEAAEAGIEKALGGVITSDVEGQSVSSTIPDDRFSVDIVDIFQVTERIFEGIEAGDVATVNLEPPAPTSVPGDIPNNANVLVCWGRDNVAGSSTAPAAEVILFSRGVGPLPQDMWAVRWAYDPITARRGVNRFTEPTPGPAGAVCPTLPDGGVFNYKTVVTPIRDAPSFPIYLQVKLLYNGATPQPVAIKSACPACGGGWNWTIPFQGREIVAIGTAGSTTKKLGVKQNFSDPWPIFSNALFAGNEITTLPALGH